MYNDSKTETNPSETHTPWREHNTGGSFKSFRSECLYTPISNQSEFTFQVKPSILRGTPTTQNATCYCGFETNKKEFPQSIQGGVIDCHTCYSGYLSPSISAGLRPTDASRTWNSLKYYDPLYFYPQKDIKERRKKYYKKLLNKYKNS